MDATVICKQLNAEAAPKEWRKLHIRDISPIQRGFDLPNKEIRSGPYPVVYSNGIGKYNAKAMVRGPGVITGRSGTLGVVHYVENDYWPHNTSLWVTDFKGNLPKFIFYLFKYIGFERFASGSGVPTLNRNDAHCYELSIPIDPSEQHAIAEALGDADALIEGLENLIAKKRLIKQGAMQELLTGKRRLPGFSEEWEVKRLAEVSWFQEGPGVRSYDFRMSGIKLLNGTNIYDGSLYLESTTRFISNAQGYSQYAHFLADAGDIVIASSGITIDRFHEKIATVGLNDLPLCMNTSTIRFKPKHDLLASQYLMVFLGSTAFKRQIGGEATGSAQLNFGPSHLSKIEIPLPPVEEQNAIADVISDIVQEIIYLERKLEKARQIKQGMMQELLTGRIRLI